MSFFITVIVEWPFYWWALRSRLSGWKDTLLVTIALNALSYLYLVYSLASVSVGPSSWKVSLCRPSQMQANPSARVFYLSPGGNRVMQVRLDGSPPTQFLRLDQPAPNGLLGFVAGSERGFWTLAVQRDISDTAHFLTEIGPGRAATRPTDKTGALFHD